MTGSINNVMKTNVKWYYVLAVLVYRESNTTYCTEQATLRKATIGMEKE